MNEWKKSLISTIPELNFETGIKYCCDSEDIYIKVLAKYADTDYSELLEQYYNSQDWESYKTTVHGIKSSALTIGLLQLSDDAKALEYAAKESDVTYLTENHLKFIKNYRNIINKLKDLCK